MTTGRRASLFDVLGAFLTDRTPLTQARIQKRIRAGAPVFATTPDRTNDAPRRVRYSQLSPEAVSVILGSQAGDANRLPTSVPDSTGAIYRQAQTMLSAWRVASAACDPPDFGLQSSDLSGDATPRTVKAIASFQRWANSTMGANVRDDGQLDDVTLGLLFAVVGNAPAPKTETKSVFPWWAVGLAVVGAVAYSEFAGDKKHYARSR